MKTRTQAVLLVGVVIVLAVIQSASLVAEQEVRLQLRWVHQFQFAGYYMARELGYYREAGLEVDIIEGGPHALKPASDVLSGKVDFAISNSGVVIRRMEGEPVVALAAIAQTSPIVWIVRADSGIYSPLDLDGKRLMLMPPPESAELLAMLRQEGIDINQLDLIETTLDLGDLIEGRVDAYDGYITNEPWYLEKMGLDYRLIRPRDYGVNFYNDVLITRESMIRNHPAEVEAFVDASLRGWKYALDNTEETVQLIHEKYATNKSLEHLMYEAEHFRTLVMPDLVALGHMNPARWQSIAETYRAFDMVDGPVELEGFIYQGSEPADLAWLYRVVTLTLVVIGLLGLIAFYFARMNRKLVREAQRRKRVEDELRAKQQELYRLASTDPLTGLWNRLKFEEIAAAEIRRAERYGYPLSIIFLDLDHFKRINDQHGHAYGDRALTEVARLINRSLRDSDCVCRWGGEEFLILVPHLDLEATAEVAEKLRETIATCDLQTGVDMSVSLGIATLNEGEGLEDLIRKADKALYEAKAKGRNRVERAD